MSKMTLGMPWGRFEMIWPRVLATVATIYICAAQPVSSQAPEQGAADALWADLLTWRTSTETDAMRGLEWQSATIASTTTLDLSAPYGGGSKLVLRINRDPRFVGTIAEYQIVITIAPGQVICDRATYGSNSCIVWYRIDGGPVKMLGGSLDSSSAEYTQFVADGSANQAISGYVGSKQLDHSALKLTRSRRGGSSWRIPGT